LLLFQQGKYIERRLDLTLVIEGGDKDQLSYSGE